MATTGSTAGKPFAANQAANQAADKDVLVAALAEVQDAIIMVDARFCVTYLNAKAAQQYEVDAAALGRPLTDLYEYRWLHPGDEEAAMQALGRDGHWRGENLHVLPNGKTLHVESTVTLLNTGGGSSYMLAVIRDMTAQKQAEAVLREAQQWQQLALEGAQLGTWVIDVDSGATQWDARCREIFGLGPEEPASSEKGFAIIHPDDRDRAMAAFAAASDPASAGVYEVEKRIVWPGGAIRWIATRGRVFFEEINGVRRARRLTGVVIDITDRKLVEARLLRANQRVAVAESAAHGFIYEWNVVTGEVERTQGIYELLGYTPAEVAENIVAWGDLVHPDDLAVVGADWMERLWREERYSLEYRLRHRDGHYVYVWDQGIVEKDGAGAPLRVVGITADITARKRIEQALHESQERFRLAIEKAPLSFAHMDRELRYTWMYNPHPDFVDNGVLGKRDDELAQNAGIDQFVAAKQRVLDTGLGMREEFTFPLSDGLHTYDITFEPLHDANGAIVGLTTAALDITERKQTQAALKELNDTLEQRVAERTAELERSNRELDRFAYIASHDLKSPLRAIDNLSAWIEEDAAAVLSPTSQAHLAKLRSRIARLENLLDDLLLYSRAGRRRHAPEWVNTELLVHSIVELLAPPPGMQVLIEGELPTVRCERPPFETVLRNLIENAVKHHHQGDQGVIVVSAFHRGDMIEFRVRDNGPGIDPQYHERIFEVFQTLRPRDEVEGSGMGLAIVKKTVESAGGRVWVESTRGAGATFCFTWPPALAS